MPPKDVVNQINGVVKGAQVVATTKLSLVDKFAILNDCYQQLGHGVPNSSLHEIHSVG